MNFSASLIRSLLATLTILAVVVGLAPVAAAASAGTAGTVPGTVLGSRPASHLVEYGSSGNRVRATKFRYLSTTQHGDAAQVTGMLFEPSVPWRGRGERPTVIMAPGTRGAGDTCAPSRSHFLIGSFERGHLNANYEYGTQVPFVEHGVRVIVTDYIGLGTPGHHTYVNNIESAHAVLDAARAGLKLAGAGADAPVGFFGYSQGGGSAAAAAEHAATYAPDLNVKGTYAGAPVADLSAVMHAVDGGDIAHVMGYGINGFASRDAEFRAEIFRNLNARGKRFLRSAAFACVGDSIATWGFTDSRSLTKTGESFGDLMDRNDGLRRVLREQKLGYRRLNAPMLIGATPTDQTVPYRQARQLGQRHCAAGENITFLPVHTGGPVRKTAANHATGYLLSAPQGVDFLLDRFNGKAAHSNCARLLG
ncbi:lipase family protein [Corynebacterium incognita]|uniref:lipase family protein n=1 Tax=Corynebacterium incognita TaxID=2754725 RepID=UPI001FE8C10E|nr:lipase family protein [Corynebacterium incognita]